MKMRLSDSVGMVAVLASLLMAWHVLEKNYADSRGTRLYLPHECSQEEVATRGDGRPIFVAFRADHSSTLNNEFMPTETDLRRLVATIMSTRAEPALTFVAEESSSFRDVSSILSQLSKDNPGLYILFATHRQAGPLNPIDWRRVGGLCYSVPDPVW